MLWYQENQRVRVKKIEHKDSYTTAQVSSSRKKSKDSKEYVYSNFSSFRFVGEAHQFMMENVEEGDIITLLSSGEQQEPYQDKDGNTQFPRNPQRVAFKIGMYRKASGEKKEEELLEEENPFGE